MKAQDLKNSILQLAIQGKLVPQDESDEPAEVLYAKIQAEKQKLIKEGKIKKDKPLPPITDDEIPFPIPATWKWVRLGNIGDWGAGATPNRSNSKYYDGNIPWLKTGDLNDGVITNIPETISDIAVTETSAKLKPIGSVLIAMYGATIGKLGILGIEATTNQACCACIPMSGIYNKYLFYYLLSQRKNFIQQGAGGAQPNISKEKIVPTLFPLPPLAEQHRIVAKIEELEPLIKQYEQAETELSTLNEAFPEQLKKSILQYAIQGKLVPQDQNDEPAEVLYAKIQAEKQKLIKEGKIKKDKPLPPITDDEIPFQIPSTWKWVRLGDIVTGIPTKDYQILQSEILAKGCYPVVSQSQKLIEGYSNKVEKLYKHDNPILVFGDHTRCLKLINFDFIVGADGVRILYPYKINEKYLYHALEYFIINMTNRGYSRHFQFIKDKAIPLPPLAEQKRIVAKVNDLMEYCKMLKISI